MNVTKPRLIDKDDVIDYLDSRLLIVGENPVVSALEDGVSARVYLVESESTRWVVKQALPELRVDHLWRADPRRALTEAKALLLAGSILRDSVPEVIDVDGHRFAITMTAAPSDWRNWRATLLAGPAGATTPQEFETTAHTIAERLGDRLGKLHSATWGRRDVEAEFGGDSAFEELRVTPFYRTVESQHPTIAHSISRCIEEVTTVRECLVHGDFSPKNILASDSTLWILDFEVARYGAAVFDLAFFCHHLALKALARPEFALSYRRAWDGFYTSYHANNANAEALSQLGWHTAALMLSRIDGVSPVGYLKESERVSARGLALSVLTNDTSTIDELWDTLIDAREWSNRA